MTLPLFLPSLCLMKTACKFLQIYVPVLSELISRLYSVSLFFPLGEWPHHTPHSWNRSHLQNVLTNTSCLLQSSNIRSLLREVWSGAAQLTPLLLCSGALTLFWAGAGTCWASAVWWRCLVPCVSADSQVAFTGRKHHPWERGKWKADTDKAVPKVLWRICEFHKCTDLIIWLLDSCGLKLLWNPVIADVSSYKNLETTT